MIDVHFKLILYSYSVFSEVNKGYFIVVVFKLYYFLKISADKEAKSFGEEQTPLHYAAKNDAVDSLKALIKIGCNMEVRDSKLRTPLQVAAELGDCFFL